MSNLLQVYRLENLQTGTGPYRDFSGSPEARDLTAALCGAHHDRAHPTGFDEGEPWDQWHPADLPYIMEEEIFGFLYLEQLVKWFGDFLEPLLANGFVIRVLDVPEDLIRLGNSQVSIKTEQSKSIP